MIKSKSRREYTPLDRKFLNLLLELWPKLKDCRCKWALAGKLGENLQGVNVIPDKIVIAISGKNGIEELWKNLQQYNPSQISEKEIKLDEKAMLKESYDVFLRCRSFEISSDPRIVVMSNIQIRVNSFEWGDVIEFEPEILNIVGKVFNVVPLSFYKEIYMSLGWVERATRVEKAIHLKHHMPLW